MALGTAYMTFVRLYAEASGQDYGGLVRKLGSTGVKSFTMRVSGWRKANDWTDAEVSAFIHFCHVHNPAMLSDRSGYGNMDVLARCLAFYKRWVRANSEVIERDGLLASVFATAPEYTREMVEQAMGLDQLRETHGAHRS